MIDYVDRSFFCQNLKYTIIYKATILYNGAIIFIAATFIKIGAELM